MIPASRFAPLLLLGVLAVSACNSGLVKPVPLSDYMDPQYKDPVQGKLFGDQGLVLGVGGKSGKTDVAANAGAALGVNAYLWRAALDTLSFMPLASADPFGGVIITDWYQPPSSPDERFKATAYILGRQLRADGIRLSIFRQTLQNGQWVEAPVDRATTADIENKVLARARQLRAQSGGS